MATVKIHSFSVRLDKKIRYARNPNKTDKGRLVSGVNIGEPLETSYQQMKQVKLRFDKEGGILGYHIIQSFRPDEVTPEQAHAIGVEFARRILGTDYQAIVSTHIDKAHLHNHIVFNSVSKVNGIKYHDGGGKNLSFLRSVSDDICKAHHLSTIENPKRSKYAPYNMFIDEQSGKKSVRSFMRDDVDEAIRLSSSFQHFLVILRKMEYEIDTSRKHLRIKPFGKERYVRAYSLGADYNEESIVKRIRENRKAISVPAQSFDKRALSGKNGKSSSSVSRYKRHSKRKKKRNCITGTYIHYRYILKSIERKSYPYRPPLYLKEDLQKLQNFSDKTILLRRYRIKTSADLEIAVENIKSNMSELDKNRQLLREALRIETDEKTISNYLARIDSLTKKIKSEYRKSKLLEEVLKENQSTKQKVQNETEKIEQDKQLGRSEVK